MHITTGNRVILQSRTYHQIFSYLYKNDLETFNKLIAALVVVCKLFLTPCKLTDNRCLFYIQPFQNKKKKENQRGCMQLVKEKKAEITL